MWIEPTEMGLWHIMNMNWTNREIDRFYLQEKPEMDDAIIASKLATLLYRDKDCFPSNRRVETSKRVWHLSYPQLL